MIAQVARAGIGLILQHGSVVAGLNLTALHSELAQRSARIRKAPFQVPWQAHVHQLELEDLDGNVLIVWGDLP